MSVLGIMAGLLLAQAAAPIATVEARAEQGTAASRQIGHVDVGFRELSRGQPEAAIARIHANHLAIEVGDPAALINLGTAHARLGRRDKAVGYYKAAIVSKARYDLQLADGTWMDSRRAARKALTALGQGEILALR